MLVVVGLSLLLGVREELCYVCWYRFIQPPRPPKTTSSSCIVHSEMQRQIQGRRQTNTVDRHANENQNSGLRFYASSRSSGQSYGLERLYIIIK